MITQFFGGVIELDEKDGEMTTLMKKDSWEWRKTDYMKAHLKPGQIFVDAGAYVGYFSLIAAKLVGATGRVYAFEPNIITYEKLMNNIERNDYKHCWPYPYALYDKAGRADLNPRDGKAAWSTLLPSYDGETETAATIRLDDILMHIEHIDMVKMDVEGVEAAALRGMNHYLNQPMTLLMDLHSELGANPLDVETILKTAGFALYDMRAGNTPIDTIPPSLVELLAVR
jgi:FkbM family methyltransferase